MSTDKVRALEEEIFRPGCELRQLPWKTGEQT